MIEKGNSFDRAKMLNEFTIIRNESEFREKLSKFISPVISHYYELINEAMKIESLFN